MYKYQKWNESDVDKLKNLYSQKISLKVISENLGFDLVSVKNALKRHGIRRKADYSNLTIKEMSECDKAYLAGIVDGEGSIQINKRTTSLNSGEKSPLYVPILKVYNNDPRLIRHIKHITGCGSISLEKRKKKHRTRPTYRWFATKSVCLQVLKTIYDYLVIKKEQADVVFEFQKTYVEKYCRRGTPLHVVSFRESCFKKLKDMHHQLFNCELLYEPSRSQ